MNPINPLTAQGGFSSPSVTGQVAKRLRDEIEKQDAARWQKDAADAAASTTTAEQALYSNTSGAARTVAKAGYLPSAALTAHDTTNAVLTVRRRDSAGANPVTVAALTTNLASGSWVAFLKKDFGAVTNVLTPSLGPDWCLARFKTTGTEWVVIAHGRV